MEIQVFLQASQISEKWVGHMSPDDSQTCHYGRDNLKHVLIWKLLGGELVCEVDRQSCIAPQWKLDACLTCFLSTNGDTAS